MLMPWTFWEDQLYVSYMPIAKNCRTTLAGSPLRSKTQSDYARNTQRVDAIYYRRIRVARFQVARPDRLMHAKRSELTPFITAKYV